MPILKLKLMALEGNEIITSQCQKQSPKLIIETTPHTLKKTQKNYTPQQKKHQTRNFRATS